MDIKKKAKNIGQAGTIGRINTNVVSKQSLERKKNKKKKNITRLAVFFFILLLLILLSRASFLRITSVEISSGLSNFDRESVDKIINTSLQKKYLFLIPENNIFIAHTDRMSDKLAADISGITNISVKKDGLHSLIVNAEPRKPAYKVLGFEKIYVDNSGIIFEKNTNEVSTSTVSISETTLALSGDTQSLPVDFNNKVGTSIDEAYLKNINLAVQLLKTKNFVVSGVILYPYKDVEFVLETYGGKIRINMDDDVENAIAIFSSAKKIEPLRSAVVDKSKIEYIDLRFGNKVFFKLK
jgi:hypothetical protein